jgi:hypothetical protein
MNTDFLRFGDALKAHITDKLEGIRAVKMAGELSGLEERSIGSPSIFIIYQGDRPPRDSMQFATHYTTQRWLVVIAVRNKTDAAGSEGTQRQAGPVIGELISIMEGWHPGDGIRRPQRIPAPAPGWSPGGFGYYPVAYEVDILNQDD